MTEQLPTPAESIQELQRRLAFDEVWSSRRIALARIEDFRRDYPDAAPFVEQARAALANTYVPLTRVSAQLRESIRRIRAHTRGGQ
jgi:hypothetical protein